LLATLVAFLPGCSNNEDIIVQTGAGKELDAPQIDKEPLALLPSGVVGIASIDTVKLFASPFGNRVLALLNQHLPVPVSADFQPARDVQHLYLGLYSMQGADMSGVAIGKFNKAKIEAAVNGIEKTPQGVPIAKRQYAGRTLYTAGGAGFCVPLTTPRCSVTIRAFVARWIASMKVACAGKRCPGWTSC